MAKMNAANVSAAASDSDSEYEYEYADETEDFYFTLDVTKYQSQAVLKPNQSTWNNKLKRKQPAHPTDRLQIVDLHSDSPLIKLGDSFYGCQWSTDLGTQFYVTKAGVVDEPLRAGYVLDVLGISRARLTGKPVTLHHRKSDAAEESIGTSAINGIVLDLDDEEANSSAAPVSMQNGQQHPIRKSISRLATARQNARDPLVKAQASFLERLAIIKRQKGETDTVPVRAVENLTGPGQDIGNAATTRRSSGKRKSVSNDVIDRPDSGEPNGKRHLSETHIVQDVDGVSSIRSAQPSNGHADLSSQQDQVTRDDTDGEHTSGLQEADKEAVVNSDPNVTDGQIMEQTEEIENQP